MEDKKIIVLDVAFLTHSSFFDYLDKNEKLELENLIYQNKAALVGIEINNKVEYCSIIEVCNNSLHIREVAGNFYKNISCLDIFTTSYAKFKGLSKVTLVASKKAVAKLALKRGFIFNNDMFEKVL